MRPQGLGTRPFPRRTLTLAVAALVVSVLVACTGRGGGYLPPDVAFSGPASFGFTFSCERSSSSTSPNPPTGRLRIELAYTDHGSNPIGSRFSLHGIVDTINPVLESAICIGQNPPPGVNELIFLGRYSLTSSAPAGFPNSCPTRQTLTSPLCRFEVIVQDNDLDGAPSTGDFFSIKLSTITQPMVSDLGAGFYVRAGLLEGGNLTVE